MFLQITDAIKRFFGKFDSIGLRQSIPYLNVVAADIIWFPIERQARFADVITASNARNMQWITDQFIDFDPNNTMQFDLFNATAIGNLAYLALN